MNIDERLEALAQSQTKADDKIKQLTALQSETAVFINQLARIADSHEHRIEELAAETEHRIQRLADETERRIQRLADETRAAAVESRAAAAEAHAADKLLGERIASLVSGFGEFIAKVDQRLTRMEEGRGL
jgi:DNA repair exonuclease SbcCD ATPase subunit